MLISNCDDQSQFTPSGPALALADEGTIKVEGANSLKLTSALKKWDYAHSDGSHNCGTTTQSRWTQSFTAPSTKIDKVTVKLARNSDFSDVNVVVELFAADANQKPTGSPLKAIDIAATDFAIDPSATEVTKDFVVTGLTQGQVYVMVIRGSFYNDSHYFKIYVDGSTSAGESGRKVWYYNDSTSTWIEATSINHLHLKIQDVALGENAYNIPVPTLNLSKISKITFWARSDRTGSLMRFQMGEGGDIDQHTYNIAISVANTWERKEWSITDILSTDKDAINRIGFQVIDDTNDFLMYIDEIEGIAGGMGGLI